MTSDGLGRSFLRDLDEMDFERQVRDLRGMIARRDVAIEHLTQENQKLGATLEKERSILRIAMMSLPKTIVDEVTEAMVRVRDTMSVLDGSASTGD